MPTLTKYWSDGEPLSVTYTGNGDGVATIVADENTGEDRSATLVFTTQDGSKSQSLEVTQSGMREPFADFYVKDGKFLVLKSK